MDRFFSDIVKDVRTHLNMSQEEFAHELGVSFATINRWENGKTTPSRLARTQFELFCKKMNKSGRYEINEGGNGKS